MNFRRTPATESSMIYGVALLLGFLFLAAFNGWGPAIALSQWLAFLLLLPTWILHTLAARFIKFKSKYRSFFVNISVVSIISIVALVVVQVIVTTSSNVAKIDRIQITNAFGMLVFVYFISACIGAAVTQWVFLKNADVIVAGKSEYGAVPASAAAKTQQSKSKKKK